MVCPQMNIGVCVHRPMHAISVKGVGSCTCSGKQQGNYSNECQKYPHPDRFSIECLCLHVDPGQISRKDSGSFIIKTNLFTQTSETKQLVYE